MKRHRKTANYQTFVQQLYHASLACIFNPLKAGMTTPEIVMVISSMQCLDWGHISWIIPNKYDLLPLFRGGAQSEFFLNITQAHCNWLCGRCDAHPNNLDRGGAHWQNHEKTDFLIGVWDPGILWNDFGIQADIVVSFYFLFWSQGTQQYLQPFTHGFPCANIHELLSLDLLHQVIKGTFKDHIVMWVNQYLMEEHGRWLHLP